MNAKATLTSHESMLHASVRFKQKAAIEKIKRDNDELKEELLLANKVSVQPTKQSSMLRIAQLQDEADSFTRQIELEKRKLGVLDIKMEKLSGKITTLRRSMGGITASRDSDRVLEKQIKVLENRLEKAYRKYSEGLTKNRQLREMIDNLRRERLMLESINLGLEKERETLQKEMATILRNTSAMHEARETAFDEISKLKTRSEKKQASFEKEWAELTALINQDRHAQEAKRIQEMEERERKTQELLKSTQDSEEIRKTLRRSSWQTEKRSHAKNDASDELQRYECAFERIREATGIEEMEEVVERIATLEDENYTLFNYTQELDKDVDAVYQRIAAAKSSRHRRESSLDSVEHSNEGNLKTTLSDKSSQEKIANEIIDLELREMLIKGVQLLLRKLDQQSVDAKELTIDKIPQHLSNIEFWILSVMQGFPGAIRDIPGISGSVKLSIAAPSTQNDDNESLLNVDSLDEEQPWLGKDLRTIVATSIECTKA